MARKSYLAANREFAYRMWRECNQNVTRTLVRLREHPEGFPLTKPTLYNWMKEDKWEERAARAEAEERKVTDAVVGAEAKAIAVLTRVIGKMEEQLESPSGIDPQMVFAYRNVVKTYMELQMKTGAYKASLFLEFLRDLIDFFAKHDQAAVAVIEQNFDNLAAWAKEKYAG